MPSVFLLLNNGNICNMYMSKCSPPSHFVCVCVCLHSCGHHRPSGSEQRRPAETSGLPEQPNDRRGFHHHGPQLIHQHLRDAEHWILPLAHDAHSLMHGDACGSQIPELHLIFHASLSRTLMLMNSISIIPNRLT